jgi:hypothetical protein
MSILFCMQTMAPLSSPHRTHAAQTLCEILDKMATIFPGAGLRVSVAMHPPRRIGLAFPGPRVERAPPYLARFQIDLKPDIFALPYVRSFELTVD